MQGRQPERSADAGRIDAVFGRQNGDGQDNAGNKRGDNGAAQQVFFGAETVPFTFMSNVGRDMDKTAPMC